MVTKTGHEQFQVSDTGRSVISIIVSGCLWLYFVIVYSMSNAAYIVNCA